MSAIKGYFKINFLATPLISLQPKLVPNSMSAGSPVFWQFLNELLCLALWIDIDNAVEADDILRVGDPGEIYCGELKDGGES